MQPCAPSQIAVTVMRQAHDHQEDEAAQTALQKPSYPQLENKAAEVQPARGIFCKDLFLACRQWRVVTQASPCAVLQLWPAFPGIEPETLWILNTSSSVGTLEKYLEKHQRKRENLLEFHSCLTRVPNRGSFPVLQLKTSLFLSAFCHPFAFIHLYHYHSRAALLLSPARHVYSGSEQNSLALCNLQRMEDYLNVSQCSDSTCQKRLLDTSPFSLHSLEIYNAWHRNYYRAIPECLSTRNQNLTWQ